MYIFVVNTTNCLVSLTVTEQLLERNANLTFIDEICGNIFAHMA